MKKPGNANPTVSITSPGNGSSFIEGGKIILKANAADSDGNIVKVEYFQGNSKLGESKISPYDIEWKNIPKGSFDLTAKATDDKGSASFSSKVKIEIVEVKKQDDKAATEGLLGYWPFEEKDGSVAKDLSGNENHANLQNDVSRTGKGAIGAALYLEKENGKVLMSTIQWKPTKYSVSWWIYPYNAKDYNQRIGAENSWGAFLFHTTKDGAIYVGTDAYSRFTPRQLPAGTFELNEWNHFVFTFDQGTASFYKNGKLLATLDGMTMPDRWNGLSLSSSEAMVDEVRLYDRAISAKTVESLYKKEEVGQTISVAITSPKAENEFEPGSDIKVQVSTSGDIKRVAYFNHNDKLGESTKAPFAFEWKKVKVGNYEVTAVAYDKKGTALSSKPIVIYVKAEAEEGDSPYGEMIGYWPFEENSGPIAEDKSGNKHDGKMLGDLERVKNGVLGAALHLRNNRGKVLMADITWKPTKFSVSWWVLPYNAKNYNQRIGAENTWGAFLFHTADDGSIYVGIDANSRFTPAELPAGTLELNKWNHFVFTFDNGNAAFYKNGKLLATMKDMVMPKKWEGLSLSYADALVDEVRLFDHAIGEDQVNGLYEGGGETSTAASEMMAGFRFHPVPAKDYLHITHQDLVEENLEILITDMTNKKMVSEKIKFTGRYSLDLNKLENGLYLIKIMGRGHTNTERLLISK